MHFLPRTFFLFAMLIYFFTGTVSAVQEIPDDIYQWVQSTDRANYFFNKQQITYRVDDDGYIDLNTLIVPTLCTYDGVQIQDVIQKRRWRNQSTKNYEYLVGRAEYLTFDLIKHTVKVTRHEDLDYAWGVLDVELDRDPVNLDDISVASVEGKFYRAILAYAAQHQQEMIERSIGKLKESDQKILNKIENNDNVSEP